ncbi:dephospho-CoA kinase [Dyadobacter arcticus]|uniref:Dephospho-CoA kinase n=1 Tax=Dyadobacter arcticus TaxID=1078754 RepID=A0ABX0UKF5_9BACT|nr:dephospho-CoA kinase [Dyadobacter arcticus]NIJ51890.1 dephospho-CoA kinase [Dyadobacter arcticus]
MSRPLQIGVTGGIGSGKSVVCQLFSCLDIPVYNADRRAKWLTNHDPEIKERVLTLLGTRAYNEQGFYDTSFVASVVFKNEELLKQLNAIIHPVVLRDTENWVIQNSASPYVIKEAAIMKAAGEGNALDYVIVVEAPFDLRIERILERDKRSEEEVKSIIQRQVSDESRRRIGDFIVANNEVSELIPQVLELHQLFLRKILEKLEVNI